VVTAGVQSLKPGQRVRLAGAPPPSAADSEPKLEALIAPAAEAK